MARLYEYCLSRNASLAWCSGNPLWWRCDTYSVELTRVDSQSQLTPYSRCCPLLYPSQPVGSISSCPQLTLTEVTHFVDPRSGSLVTLGHSAPSNNTRDVISNGISDSRTLISLFWGSVLLKWSQCIIHVSVANFWIKYSKRCKRFHCSTNAILFTSDQDPGHPGHGNDKVLQFESYQCTNTT